MSKPPKITIPGLNRGAGIPAGYVLGRLPGTGKGPAQLLDLTSLRRVGLATAFTLTASTSLVQSIAHSETVSLSTAVSSSLSSVVSTNVGQSTSLSQISSSLSGAISSTSSLSTAVSTVDSGQTVSLSQISNSLSTTNSTNVTQSTSLSQISSSLSGAISSTSSLSTAVSTVISGSISAANSRIDSLSTAGGGGGGGSPAWTEIQYYDATASGATASVIGDVTGYNEILIVFNNVVLASSGWRVVQVSVDGGSTYYTTLGNYVAMDTNGVASNDVQFYSHSTSASAARYGSVHILNSQNPRLMKVGLTLARSSSTAHFVGSTNAITHVKALGASSVPAGINMNTGQIGIYAR